MNRVKKSKMKKKQKIKETIIGLSLAIFIGVAGSVGSYAYFSDRVEADNGIKITMGTLDTSIAGEDNKYINGATYDNSNILSEFTIKNEGTLDQLVTLNLIEQFNNIDNSKIRYNITIEHKGNTISNNTYNSTNPLTNPLTNPIIEKYRLNSGDILTCTIEIIDSKKAIVDIYKDANINFELKAKAIQINNI